MRRFLKYFLPVVALSLSVNQFIQSASSSALSGSQFRAERIVDDSVFFRNGDLSVTQIQNFLNSKVPACDTNHARTSSPNDSGPPYTCLKDYRTSTVAKPAEDELCSAVSAKTNQSAAQIIHDVSQACGVSTRVLLVLLQKEQSLVTDTWPWAIQYRSATGYGCPDTADCDSNYYGFFNQVYHAARVYKVYKKIDGPNYRAGYTNFIQWHPNAGCGGSNVTIQSQATAGLYNYTPYRPNNAALNNLYGTGDSCSSYGNRNFWRMYNDWFGSTFNHSPYSWVLESQEAYSDSARTRVFSSTVTAAPGQKIYMRISALNTGDITWQNTNTRLGTTHPENRTSPFSNGDWVNAVRPAGLVESSVSPGQVGTFEFTLTMPSQTGSYREYFNILQEGTRWLADLGLFYEINVVSSVGAVNTSNINLQPGTSLERGQYLMSPDAQSTLLMQGDGNLVLYRNFVAIWSTQTAGSSGQRVTMQNDGNLVLYNSSGQPLWHTGTYGNSGSRLSLQTDANLVVYSSTNSPLWSTSTVHNPNLLAYVNTSLPTANLFPVQRLETANRQMKLILQGDGNLVLYNSQGNPIWHTGTNGKGATRLTLQSDGNLVLYNAANKALWNSRTSGKGYSRLVIQPDGNLVLYDNSGRPTWNTRTAGQQ